MQGFRPGPLDAFDLVAGSGVPHLNAFFGPVSQRNQYEIKCIVYVFCSALGLLQSPDRAGWCLVVSMQATIDGQVNFQNNRGLPEVRCDPHLREASTQKPL